MAGGLLTTPPDTRPFIRKEERMYRSGTGLAAAIVVGAVMLTAIMAGAMTAWLVLAIVVMPAIGVTILAQQRIAHGRQLRVASPRRAEFHRIVQARTHRHWLRIHG